MITEINDDVLNNTKQLSSIYDELSEDIIDRKYKSLPDIDNIKSGKNYISFLNFWIFLYNHNIIDVLQQKLYIKVQYELIWKNKYYSRYKHKVVPVGLMYNDRAFDNFVYWLQNKEITIGKSKIDKYLDHYVSTPLLPDKNISSLHEDIDLVITNLRKLYKSKNHIDNQDLINVVTSIENRNVPVVNTSCISPAYLILNTHIDINDFCISHIFKDKISKIKKSIKSRGPEYLARLQNKKQEIISSIPLTQQEKEVILPYV